jgi:hypothetical protein
MINSSPRHESSAGSHVLLAADRDFVVSGRHRPVLLELTPVRYGARH